MSLQHLSGFPSHPLLKAFQKSSSGDDEISPLKGTAVSKHHFVASSKSCGMSFPKAKGVPYPVKTPQVSELADGR